MRLDAVRGQSPIARASSPSRESGHAWAASVSPYRALARADREWGELAQFEPPMWDAPRMRWPPLLVCSLVACGPVVLPDAGDGSSSGVAEEGTTAATHVTTTTTTAGTITTSLPPTSTTDGDDADDVVDDGILWDCGGQAPPGHQPRCTVISDSPGGGGGSVCDPQPELDVVGWVLVDDGNLPAERPLNPYVYACTIAEWLEGGGTVSLSLACEDGGHMLVLGTSTGISFDTTGDFVLSVIHSAATFGGGDQLVTLRRAGGELVLAGASTPWRPDHGQIPADFFAPLGVELLPDVCDLEDPPDGNFLEPCFTVQRQALRFTLAGQSLDVYDHGVDTLSPYDLAVQTAELRHDVTCTDTAVTWYSWLAAPPPP